MEVKPLVETENRREQNVKTGKRKFVPRHLAYEVPVRLRIPSPVEMSSRLLYMVAWTWQRKTE